MASGGKDVFPCKACGFIHEDPKDWECPGFKAADPKFGQAGRVSDDDDAKQTLAAIKLRLSVLEEVSRESSAVRKMLKKKAEEVLNGSTSTDSSSESSDEDSHSETSAYSRGRRVSRNKKKTHSSRRRKSRSSALKSSRFSHHRHINKGESVKTYEKLMCVSLRVLQDLLARGEDISGFINHLVVLSDKAETKFYRNDSLVAYDKAVRMAAAEKGIKKFAEVDSTLVMLHLGFDSAVSHRKPATTNSQKTKKSGYCFRFNGPDTCGNQNCAYKHECSTCGDSSHGCYTCKRVKSTVQASTSNVNK